MKFKLFIVCLLKQSVLSELQYAKTYRRANMTQQDQKIIIMWGEVGEDQKMMEWPDVKARRRCSKA